MFKPFVAVLIVANTFNIVMGVFDVAQHVINQSGGIIAGSTAISAADLDAVAKEHGYASVTLNDNGSVTYVLTKEQHEELLSKLKEGIDEKIAYLPSSSKSYKDITSISANDDYTDFVINLDAKSISDKTSMAMLELKLLSTMYNAFNGNGNASFHAVYYGTDGQVLADTDSDKENSVPHQ